MVKRKGKIRTGTLHALFASGFLSAALALAMPLAARGEGMELTDTWLNSWDYEIKEVAGQGKCVCLKEYTGWEGDVYIYGQAMANGINYQVCIDNAYDSSLGRYVSGLARSHGIKNLAFMEKGGKKVMSSLADRFDHLFYGMEDLENVRFHGNLEGEAVQAQEMFRGCGKLKSVDLETLSLGSLGNMQEMFRDCGSLEAIRASFPKGANYIRMFKGCVSLRTAEVGGGREATSGIMPYSMFEDCSSLTSVDLSDFDTSKCTNFSGMFRNCSSMEEIGLRSMDLGNAVTLDSMFEGCSSLRSADLSGSSFKAEEVSAASMFYGCGSLEEVTVPESLNINDCSYGMFYTDEMRRIRVKGSPSEAFVENVMSKFARDNRYIGTVKVRASVELENAELKDGIFMYSLEAPHYMANGSNSGGTVELEAKIFRPGETAFRMTEALKVEDPGTLGAVAVALPAEGYSCEDSEKTVTVEIVLNSDGSLSCRQ